MIRTVPGKPYSFVYLYHLNITKCKSRCMLNCSNVCCRLEHNHESCCIQDNKDDPASAIENDQNKELLCASSANKTCTIRSFSSIAEENDDDDASSKSHCYRFAVQYKIIHANSCFSPYTPCKSLGRCGQMV